MNVGPVKAKNVHISRLARLLIFSRKGVAKTANCVPSLGDILFISAQ